jgi:fructose-bisphosphate aldolase class II
MNRTFRQIGLTHRYSWCISVLENDVVFLKVDGEMGNKKVYDPRAWGKTAESAMAKRVVEATQQLGSAGHSGR